MRRLALHIRRAIKRRDRQLANGLARLLARDLALDFEDNSGGRADYYACQAISNELLRAADGGDIDYVVEAAAALLCALRL
jgi:hypothetical protein